MLILSSKPIGAIDDRRSTRWLIVSHVRAKRLAVVAVAFRSHLPPILSIMLDEANAGEQWDRFILDIVLSIDPLIIGYRVSIYNAGFFMTSRPR
jgi:hypothetical protein